VGTCGLLKEVLLGTVGGPDSLGSPVRILTRPSCCLLPPQVHPQYPWVAISFPVPPTYNAQAELALPQTVTHTPQEQTRIAILASLGMHQGWGGKEPLQFQGSASRGKPVTLHWISPRGWEVKGKLSDLKERGTHKMLSMSHQPASWHRHT
jgi:hypothetical protein